MALSLSLSQLGEIYRSSVLCVRTAHTLFRLHILSRSSILLLLGRSATTRTQVPHKCMHKHVHINRSNDASRSICFSVVFLFQTKKVLFHCHKTSFHDDIYNLTTTTAMTKRRLTATFSSYQLCLKSLSIVFSVHSTSACMAQPQMRSFHLWHSVFRLPFSASCAITYQFVGFPRLLLCIPFCVYFLLSSFAQTPNPNRTFHETKSRDVDG